MINKICDKLHFSEYIKMRLNLELTLLIIMFIFVYFYNPKKFKVKIGILFVIVSFVAFILYSKLLVDITEGEL